MCFHKRLVFGCSHFAWLDIISQPCEIEESFNRGEVNRGCSTMWSHGFDTIRIQERCPKCVERQAGDEFRLGVVKEQIKVLKEHLRMIKGLSNIPEDDWLKLDSEQDGDSEATAEDSASVSADSSLGRAAEDETGNTSFEDEFLNEEAMEEVSYDAKHRPLRLPQIVAKRMAGDAEDVQ